MPTFKLTDDEIQRLTNKFQEFKSERESVHRLLNDYIADYRQFNGNSEQRYEHLRRKFIDKVPDLSHLVFSDGEFLWSIDDISIVLGRHRTTISRSIDKMQHSEGWQAKIISLREVTKAQSGLKFYVYHQEIFDLILDLYEEEYLFRFANPRRGNPEDAPDFQEVKKFWDYLKDYELSKNYTVYREEKILPEIPAMNYKDILKLIWEKVFSVKVGTVCSVIFAVIFELTRRFYGLNVWLAFIPLGIFLLTAFLIHSRKLSPDFLSNFAAGALLFTFLWISASLSIDRFYNLDSQNENYLSPEKISKQISEQILEQIPDKLSEKILEKIPEKTPQKITPKSAVLNIKDPWLYVGKYPDNTVKIRLAHDLLSQSAKVSVKDVIYGINKDFPDTKLLYKNYTEPGRGNYVFDEWEVISVKKERNYIKSVSSYILFKDGTSSDIRISIL